MASNCSAKCWQSQECNDCELRANAKQVVVATLGPSGSLLVVGEAPGSEEDDNGEGFIGPAGSTLRALLLASGVLESDYGVANVCRCRPPKNRKPRAAEIDSCIGFLANLICENRPKVILAVGGRTAVKVLCNRQEKLSTLIDNGITSGDWKARPENAHPSVRSALAAVRPYIVPMPHTSSRLIGKAPNGTPWDEIRKQQVTTAADLLKTG